MPRPTGLAKTGGREKGTRNRRTETTMVAVRLALKGKTPAETLAGLAQEALDRGDVEGAASALVPLLPFCHARLKPIEGDPITAAAVEKMLAEARARGHREGGGEFASPVTILVDTGVPRTPTDPPLEDTEELAPTRLPDGSSRQ